MSDHLKDEQIRQYVDRTLSDSERNLVQQHLTYCDECRDRVAAFKTAEATKATQTQKAETPSPAETDKKARVGLFSAESKLTRSNVLRIGLGALVILAIITFFILRRDDGATVVAPEAADGVPHPIALADSDRPWLDAPGWDRARVVAAASTTDPVHIAYDDVGNAYMLMFVRINDEQFPYVVAINQSAETLWTQLIEVEPLSLPDSPKLVWDGEQLNLFWLSREQLFAATMALDGTLSSTPTVISRDHVVGYFDVVTTADNDVTLWYSGSRRKPGLYAFPVGDLSAEPLPMDPEGIRPSLRYDANGTLNAVWIEYPVGFEASTCFYATYPDGAPELNREVSVWERSLGTNRRLEGPILGVDATNAYLFWTLETTSGPSAGDIDTAFMTFPLGQPQQAADDVLRVPAVYDLEYTDLGEDGLAAGPRVSLQPLAYPATLRLSGIATNPVPESELAITYRTDLPYLWRKNQVQVNTAYFREGMPVAHQLITFSSTFSTGPYLRSDADKYLALTYLEQNDQSDWNVYFTTTRPETRALISAVSAEDVTSIIIGSIFGLLSGAVLAPIFVGLWMIIPVMLLFVMLRFLRGQDEGRLTMAGIVVVLIFVVVYKFVQIGSLPTDEIVPFAAWVPILSTGLGRFLQIAMPWIIAAVGLLLAYSITYRRGKQSLFFFLLVYAALDGLMMMAVYGSWFYGAL